MSWTRRVQARAPHRWRRPPPGPGPELV